MTRPTRHAARTCDPLAIVCLCLAIAEAAAVVYLFRLLLDLREERKLEDRMERRAFVRLTEALEAIEHKMEREL